MQRVFRVVDTKELKPSGVKTTGAFNCSIRRLGVLNPVLLAEVVDDDGVIELVIIDGNRRIRAANASRLPKVPAVVLKATTTQDRARLTLMCNHMRSSNFHTESAAIMTLATDEETAARAARAIGLGPARVQQLYRKIATMPEPVRQAMYEHRLPVTAASGVGSWPEGLQQEVIELLSQRRYVNTTMLKDLREWYADRHPEEFGVVEAARDDVPLAEWSDTGLRPVDIPAPPIAPGDTVGGWVARSPSIQASGDHVPAPTREPLPPSREAPATVQPTHQHRELGHAPRDPGVETAPDEPGASGPTWSRSDHREDTTSVPTATVAPVAMSGRNGSLSTTAVTDNPAESAAGVDHRAERMVALVVRLDAGLREFAREGHELGIDRAVWVDRTMRAWDGAGR